MCSLRNMTLQSVVSLMEKLEFKNEIKIPVQWGHISAKVWGPDDGVPAIAIHGLMDNAGSFDLVAPLLPPNIRLICMELCGHGHSDAYPPGVILHYFDHAYHLKLVIDYFKWEKVIIIGHSVGAIAAVLYASLYPEKVNKLISLDVAKPFAVSMEKLPGIMKTIMDQMIEFSEAEPITVTYEQARETLIDNYKGSINEKAADILLVRALKKTGEDAYEFSNDMRILLRTLTLSEDQIKILVRNITCPFLIIRAKNGLKNFSEELLREYLDIYRSNSQDFRYVEIEGTHHVHLTHPERVALHIRQFIMPLLSSKL